MDVTCEAFWLNKSLITNYNDKRNLYYGPIYKSQILSISAIKFLRSFSYTNKYTAEFAKTRRDLGNTRICFLATISDVFHFPPSLILHQWHVFNFVSLTLLA